MMCVTRQLGDWLYHICSFINRQKEENHGSVEHGENGSEKTMRHTLLEKTAKNLNASVWRNFVLLFFLAKLNFICHSKWSVVYVVGFLERMRGSRNKLAEFQISWGGELFSAV